MDWRYHLILVIACVLVCNCQAKLKPIDINSMPEPTVYFNVAKLTISEFDGFKNQPGVHMIYFFKLRPKEGKFKKKIVIALLLFICCIYGLKKIFDP